MANLTRNEIRKRLSAFAKAQQGASNERSQAQTFWLRFYECFGIRAESATIYEQSVKKLSGAQGFIDSFIPGKLIVEHKSRGKDLDAAFDQAGDYFLSLNEADRPRYIITSDFARIRLYDLQAGGGFHQCALAELPKKADWFMFLLEGELVEFTEESEADRKAAYAISKLHEALLRANFKGRDLEILLTRLLFCLFAEDTGIFGENGIFRRLMEATRADGSDVGRILAELFQVLNTPEVERQNNLDEALARFAYINGKLFADNARIPSFDSELRAQLITCAQLDWSGISPAIFGAMFQGVLEEHETGRERPLGAQERRGKGQIPDAQSASPFSLSSSPLSSDTRKASRRELGAHYTSERNILRVINPLCLNELRAELAKVKRNKKLLEAFYDKLPTLTFFDPACGCGNFLVIAFRELRQLEMDTIEAMGDVGLTNASRGGLLDVSTLCRVKVSQFYGIEIDEAAAHIARVAMWITDHQMNLEAAERFGTTRPTVPLVDSATIVCGNSLRLNWHDVIPAAQCNFVLGNPPFVGAKMLSDKQRDDVALILGKIPSSGLLDYVTCWHVKAAQYIQKTTPSQPPQPLPASPCQGRSRGGADARTPSLTREGWGGFETQVAFVSTNSITQGEQVAILWSHLFAQGIQIHFAHRTFQWSNEGKGVAAVHCVIVGFGLNEPKKHVIFDYAGNIKGEPVVLSVQHINPYLVDAPDVIAEGRMTAICPVKPIANGSIPADGGNLILDTHERNELIKIEPEAANWVRPYLGAEGFINGIMRYCLWLKNCPPDVLRRMPHVMARIKAVQAMREASAKTATREKAKTPTRFTEDRQPESGLYLALPRTSSENRAYIPIGYLPCDIIAANDLQLVPDAGLYEFGILTSAMHMAWMRITSGRLKSDIRYSVKYTYNNFPWPQIQTPSSSPLSGGEPCSDEGLQSRNIGSSPDKGRLGGVRFLAIETAAQAILDARALYAESSLADLYDPLAMPPELVKAHAVLDKAVDAAYQYKGGKEDAARVAFLFERYQQLTSLLPALSAKSKRNKKLCAASEITD